MPNVSRTPRKDVLTILRREVGFCCPVTGCGSPYLTWHHFDPPWRIEKHHRPEGMVALCREHADKADNGAFTNDQIRTLKREGRSRASEVRGRFDWMRSKILTVVAGNFGYECYTALEVGGVKCIWFERDEDGYLLLNVKMPTLAQRPRAEIERNAWTVSSGAHEVLCPPSGRLVEVKYENGDRFRVEFFILESSEEFASRYPHVARFKELPEYPLTAVEIYETIAGAGVSFTPRGITSPEGGHVGGNFFRNFRGASISIGANPRKV
ncbi:hypothetical protein [Streptomyces sp. C10-9-1]|uniref:hypothetical protein n=1 Tax=Streptomyces sp. C10-9-1 TaxID=1859285 RepID=UPI003F49B9B6